MSQLVRPDRGCLKSIQQKKITHHFKIAGHIITFKKAKEQQKAVSLLVFQFLVHSVCGCVNYARDLLCLGSMSMASP